MAKGVGVAGGIPVLLKVAALEAPLILGEAVPDTEFGDIQFDKATDEVVIIYAADCVPNNLNGMGTGSEVNLIISRDKDQQTLDYGDEDNLFVWHFAKSFVTNGMSITMPNLLKTLPAPVVTSRPQIRVIGEVRTAVWTTGRLQCLIYYTTRKLDDEARRVLIGVE